MTKFRIQLTGFLLLLSFVAIGQNNGRYSRVHCISVNEAKTQLISGEASGFVKIWNIQDGGLVKNIKISDKSIRFVDFTSDTSFVCITKDGQVSVGNIRTGTHELKFWIPGKPAIFEAFYSKPSKALFIPKMHHPTTHVVGFYLWKAETNQVIFCENDFEVHAQEPKHPYIELADPREYTIALAKNPLGKIAAFTIAPNKTLTAGSQVNMSTDQIHEVLTDHSWNFVKLVMIYDSENRFRYSIKSNIVYSDLFVYKTMPYTTDASGKKISYVIDFVILNSEEVIEAYYKGVTDFGIRLINTSSKSVKKF